MKKWCIHKNPYNHNNYFLFFVRDGKVFRGITGDYVCDLTRAYSWFGEGAITYDFDPIMLTEKHRRYYLAQTVWEGIDL